MERRGEEMYCSRPLLLTSHIPLFMDTIKLYGMRGPLFCSFFLFFSIWAAVFTTLIEKYYRLKSSTIAISTRLSPSANTSYYPSNRASVRIARCRTRGCTAPLRRPPLSPCQGCHRFNHSIS